MKIVAYLTAASELGDHGTSDGGVDVCGLEDDERRVPAQLHRHSLHRRRALRQQYLQPNTARDVNASAHMHGSFVLCTQLDGPSNLFKVIQ